MIWTEEHGIKHKARKTLDVLSGNYDQTLRPANTNIEVRFGIFAIINILSFVILGIVVPFFPAEGLQGEAVVQAQEDWRAIHQNSLETAVSHQGVLDRVSWDFEKCVTDRGAWSSIDYCVGLRGDLPPYNVQEMRLTDPNLTESPYDFFVKNGDSSSKALRLSCNTSLQGIAFNAKPGGEKLLHELTCIPISLDRYITEADNLFELKIPDLVDPILVQVLQGASFDVHGGMILKTSNTIGSGYEIYKSTGQNSHTNPLTNPDGQGAT